MVEIGYFLSSEEHDPKTLTRQAQMAADVGIGSVAISDHFHPWLDDQGHSPFVWSVIGSIAATTPLSVTTMVTCPTMRIHPAIIAQAAATSAVALDGRFELGVGTGEYLNEHIYGDPWPLADERLEMLVESIDVMRQLWSGREIIYRGDYFTVENARIYTLPATPPKILMSAFGPRATDIAAEVADGFISTKPAKELLDRYRSKGGRGPAVSTMKICWGPDADDCAKRAHHLWRSSGVPGELTQDLRSPALFEQASQLVTVESMAEKIPCGPSLEPIVNAFKEHIDNDFDRVYINQIGDNHEEFFRFFSRELLPALAELGAAPDSDASRPAGE
jgi:G6PDH family F420-dependent oxidoreductase